MRERTFGALMESVHPYKLRDLVFESLFENFDKFVIGIAIVAGGFLASYILYKCILYCGLPKSQWPRFRFAQSGSQKKVETYDENDKIVWKDIEAQYVHIGADPSAAKLRPVYHHKHKKDTTKPLFYSARSSVVHFAALVLKYSVIVFAFYVAFGVAGLSVFSLAYSLGVIGLIGAYSFGTVLQNAAGAFVMTGTGRWVEGMYIRVDGGAEGKILEMSSMFTTLTGHDKARNGIPYLVTIPNKYFNEVITYRYPTLEEGMEDIEKPQKVLIECPVPLSGGGGIAAATSKTKIKN